MPARLRSSSALLVLVLSLISCGGDGEGGGDGSRPSFASTFSPTGVPTRAPAQETPDATRNPDRPPAPSSTVAPEATAPPDTATPRPRPSATVRPSDAAPPAAPSPESGEQGSSSVPSAAAPDVSAEEVAPAQPADASEDVGTPSWVWWALGAGLLAIGVAVPLVLRARRRTAWRRRLAAAEGELAWLARDLVPQLRQAASREQVAGGWAVAAGRVSTVEDELTVLEGSAPDDAGRDRARALRDATRLARARMDRVAGTGPVDTPWARDLDEIRADLEAALGPPASPS